MSLPSKNVISPMTLRPRHKVPPSRLTRDEDDSLADVADKTSKPNSLDPTDSAVSSKLITPPLPNNFNHHSLKQAQAHDPDIQTIITQLTNRTTESTTLSSFVMKDQLLHKLVPALANSPLTLTVPW
jgi:hypothetical protein